MKQKFAIYILLIASAASMMCACNKKSEDDPEIQEITYSNVAVEAFSLDKNDSVMQYLDSVYFSIDLNTATIYNADSLPVGTNVSKLVLKITLPSVNVATITEAPAPGKEAREIDYIKNPKDSISFSYGDAKLHVVSYDKKVTRDYTIKVNVHNTVPDSLCWGNTAAQALPGGVTNVKGQKAVEMNGVAYCFVKGDNGVVLSTTTDPGAAEWSSLDVTLPANARLETITAAGGTLYLLDDGGSLYASADGTAWTSCDVQFNWLYGDYAGSLLGSAFDGSQWSVVRYPQMTSVTVDGDTFPIEGTSTMLSFETKWASQPTTIFIGGRTASGALSNAAWGFDGKQWASLSNVPLPEGLEQMTLVPYFCYTVDRSKWKSTRYSVLLAWGGRSAGGAINHDVYISYDNGIRWRRASDLLQLSEYMPAVYSAQALVFPTTMHARSNSSEWTPIPTRAIPAWLTIATAGSPASRATAPIDEWECPFIYQFGGIDANGEVQNTVWRGVINRLTFKPLY